MLLLSPTLFQVHRDLCPTTPVRISVSYFGITWQTSQAIHVKLLAYLTVLPVCLSFSSSICLSCSVIFMPIIWHFLLQRHWSRIIFIFHLIHELYKYYYILCSHVASLFLKEN